MAYTKFTKYFHIPIVESGKPIEATEEERILTIIENQLMAAKKGINCCVFKDGAYSIIDNYDNTYSIVLASNSSSIQLEGMVNGGYIRTENDIVWEGLIKGKEYYLYVQYKDGMYEDPTKFNVVFSDTLKRNNNYLLLAYVDLKSNPQVDTNPNSKIYYSDLAQHILDSKDPHGETLEQSNIQVNKTLNINCSDKTVVGGLIKLEDNRETNEAMIESSGNIVFKDAIELKTENKSLHGAINELFEMIAQLKG